MCDLDHSPTKLFKDCTELFAPHDSRNFTTSRWWTLQYPQQFTIVHITLIVKITGLDLDRPRNYRAKSNPQLYTKCLSSCFTRVEHYLKFWMLAISFRGRVAMLHSSFEGVATAASSIVKHLKPIPCRNIWNLRCLALGFPGSITACTYGWGIAFSGHINSSAVRLPRNLDIRI